MKSFLFPLILVSSQALSFWAGPNGNGNCFGKPDRPKDKNIVDVREEFEDRSYIEVVLFGPSLPQMLNDIHSELTSQLGLNGKIIMDEDYSHVTCDRYLKRHEKYKKWMFDAQIIAAVMAGATSFIDRGFGCFVGSTRAAVIAKLDKMQKDNLNYYHRCTSFKLGMKLQNENDDRTAQEKRDQEEIEKDKEELEDVIIEFRKNPMGHGTTRGPIISAPTIPDLPSKVGGVVRNRDYSYPSHNYYNDDRDDSDIDGWHNAVNSFRRGR